MWTYLDDNLEASTYLPDREAESLGICYADTYPPALLKLIPIADESCLPGSATESSHGSRFGTTSGPSTGCPGSAASTSSPEGSLAKTSVPLGGARESTELKADSGQAWHGWFAKWNPPTCSWKTAHYSIFGDCTDFSETWPKWGLMRNGECWVLSTPLPLTSVSERGLKHDIPTPTVACAKGGQTSRSGKRKNELLLGGYVRRYPTPTAQDAKNNGGPSQSERNSLSLNATIGGPLNPTWVEWLMGWPIGWTDLQPLEMDKFRWWLRSHGKFLAETFDKHKPLP